MTWVAAASLRTELCPFPGCPNEMPCRAHAAREAKMPPPSRRRPERRLAAMARRTCTEVEGCTNETVSDRGRYANVCEEHKNLVTARYAEGKAKVIHVSTFTETDDGFRGDCSCGQSTDQATLGQAFQALVDMGCDPDPGVLETLIEDVDIELADLTTLATLLDATREELREVRLREGELVQQESRQAALLMDAIGREHWPTADMPAYPVTQ